MQNQAREKLIKTLKNNLKFKLFLWLKLPAARRSGVRLDHVGYEKSVSSVPYKYFTRNPFRSTYFACLGMAAEMSAGIMAMLAIEGCDPSVSFLVTGFEAEFTKKCTGRTYFTCDQGKEIFAAVEEARLGNEGVYFPAISIGRNEAGEEVARVKVMLSFKARRAK